MRKMRRWMKGLSRFVVGLFVYVLLLPPGAAPCIHHRGIAAEGLTLNEQTASAAHAGHHGGQGRHDGGLGCACCIGGMCAGGCSHCPAPTCAAKSHYHAFSLALRTTPGAPWRMVADIRTDLSAPLARPQTPRAPPAI